MTALSSQVLIPAQAASLHAGVAPDHPVNAAALAPNPGDYGVSHGSGMIGELIRTATQSWAGHAFLYVGNGLIIEAAPPATRISSVHSHPDAVWNTEEPKTDAQRAAIIARGHALLGTPYDYPAYIAFALMCLHIRTGQELDPVFARDQWRVCSADVADEYHFAGIDVEQALKTAGLPFVPNLISPANLYDRIAHRAWGHS